jgi:anti-sigma factor RsiW
MSALLRPDDEGAERTFRRDDADDRLLELLAASIGPEPLPAALEQRIRDATHRRGATRSVIFRIGLPLSAAAAAILAFALFTKTPTGGDAVLLTSGDKAEIVTALALLHVDSASPELATFASADTGLMEIETTLRTLMMDLGATDSAGGDDADWDLPRDGRDGL